MANHYATLGVDRDASPREVVRAYRRQARRHHPDVGGEAARFLDVQRAYEVLADPQARLRYDVLHAPPPRREPAPPPRAPRTAHVRRPVTGVATTLPPPSVASCQVGITLGLGTFVVPGAAAVVVHGAHGRYGLLVFALLTALGLGKAARGLAANEAECVRRHRQLWEYGYVVPELDDREHVERCTHLARAARLCAGYGLVGSLVVVLVLAVLTQTSAP